MSSGSEVNLKACMMSKQQEGNNQFGALMNNSLSGLFVSAELPHAG